MSMVHVGRKLVRHRINLTLMKKVLAHIKKDVRRLEMRHWAINWLKYFKSRAFQRDLASVRQISLFNITPERHKEAAMEKNHVPPCYTTACFAGWTAILVTPKKKQATLYDREGHMPDATDIAKDALGLDEQEAYDLFDGVGGPPKDQYKTVVKRINFILKENGISDRVK